MIGEALLHARAQAAAEQLATKGPNPHLASVPSDEYNRYLQGLDAVAVENQPLGEFQPVAGILRLGIYDDLVCRRRFDPLKDPAEYVDELIKRDMPTYKSGHDNTLQELPQLNGGDLVDDTPTRRLTIVRSLGEAGVSLAEHASGSDSVAADSPKVPADQSATPESVVHDPISLAKFVTGLKNTPLPETTVESPVDWFGTGQ